MRADCTSFFSGNLCVRIGFDIIYKLNYNDYVDEEGKPIFSPASPHTAVVTCVKKLWGSNIISEIEHLTWTNISIKNYGNIRIDVTTAVLGAPSTEIKKYHHIL